MWPFRRKKKRELPAQDIFCPHCGSIATFPSVPRGGDATFVVKSWRGYRYIERMCPDCGRTFYSDVSVSDLEAMEPFVGEEINDEDTLRLAEEDLKKRTESNGDHRYTPPW